MFLGVNAVSQNGTDALLDLLSIGSPPVQSSPSAHDILSASQDNKTSVSPLDGLSSPSYPNQSTSAGVTPVMDLLGGFAADPPKPGKILSMIRCLVDIYCFSM